MLIVNKDGDTWCNQFQMKTLKYGKMDWEAFHVQFEMLVQAVGWSVQSKTLQLALCLTEEASPCLLLLSPAAKELPMVLWLDSKVVVWTMQPARRAAFGAVKQAEIARGAAPRIG